MNFTDEQIDYIIKNCLSFYANTRQLEASSDYVRDKLSKSKSVVATHNVPINIVNDMLNMIDKEIWHNPDATVLEMAAIGNHFFSLLFLRFYFGLESKIPDRYERARHILTKQIYMFSLDLVNCMYTRTLCYGNAGIEGNCFWCRGVYQDENKKWCEKQITDVLGTLKELSLPLFKNNLIIKGLDKDMKFDVVIGNPPYNNDMYIDFVNLGFELLKDNGAEVMVTPAKWQAKSGQKNEAFRQNIVPHMSKIVYYPECMDIFEIRESGGISYYLVDKNEHKVKLVKNVCKKNSNLGSDWEEHTEESLELNRLDILDIKAKVAINGTLDRRINTKWSEFTSYKYEPTYNGSIEVMQGQEVYGYVNKCELNTTKNLEKWKVTTNGMTGYSVGYLDDNGKVLGIGRLNILKPNQVPKGSFPCLMFFDTENECKSFVSFLKTKLCGFLYYMGLSGTAMNNLFFRFIPDPGAFDHIFTDEELYKKYNLTEEEINIIESVIKERK